MEFLRKMAQQAADKFKDTADEVWDSLGDTSGVPQAYKDVSRSAGKYALTAQLLMILNFPDEPEVFSETFNVTNTGPTGASGFEGTPIGHLLSSVAKITAQRNSEAIGVQGFGDVTQTSSLDDLVELLPLIDEMAEEGK